MKIYMMISQQIAPFSQVITDQLPIKENTSKQFFFQSISTEQKYMKWITFLFPWFIVYMIFVCTTVHK